MAVPQRAARGRKTGKSRTSPIPKVRNSPSSAGLRRSGALKQKKGRRGDALGRGLPLFLCGLLLGGCSQDKSFVAGGPAETAAAAEETPLPKTLDELFPEGLGKTLVLETCGSCHAIGCSAIGQRTEARWENLKEDHRDKVASLSEQELETVFGYLKDHFSAAQPEPRVPPQFLVGGCTPF